MGALGAVAGAASVERGIQAAEGGLLLDLGWTGTPRLRLQAEVEFLGGTYSRYIEVDDRTYRSPISDFSVGVTAVYEVGGPRGRTMPYLSAGIAVHALSSAFGTAVLDQLYNANPFGSQVSVGVRQWLGAGGRAGMFIELRGVLADNVNRASVRVGALAFYRDLVHPRTR
jgi:hypothetical protein